MKSRKTHYPVTALAGLAGDVKITMRKNLNADAMFGVLSVSLPISLRQYVLRCDGTALSH